MAAGRPTKYKKIYCKRVVECLSEGGFNVTFCASIKISEDTFYEWVKVHPEFSEAVKVGSAMRKALFLKKVEEAAWNPGEFPSNNGLVYLQAHQIGVQVKPDEKDTSDGASELAEALNNFAKNPSDK